MKRLLLMTALLAVLMPVPAMAQAESAKALQGTKLRPDINVHAVVGNQRLDTPIELGAAPFSSVQVAGEVPQNLSYIVVVNATDNKGNPVNDIKINRIKLKYNKIVGSPEFPYMGTPVVQNFIIRYKPDGKPEVIDEDTGFPVARAVFVLWRTARFFDRLQTIGCLSWDFWVGYPLCIPDPWPFKNGEPTLPTRVSESRLYPLIGDVPFSVDEKSNNPWGRSQAIEIIISTDWLAEAEFEVEFDAIKKLKSGRTLTEHELAAGTFVMDLDDDGASNRYELNEGTDMRDAASYPGGPTNVTVPNVVHFPIGDAISKLASKNLEVGTVGYRNDPIVPRDSVLEQHPSAGTVVAAGSGVNLVLSLGTGGGPNKVIVPGVNGMTEQIARNTLASYHLGTGLVNEVHNSAAAGTVIGQSPSAGALVDEFSLVNLTVSLGEEPCLIPCYVIGDPYNAYDDELMELLLDAGFQPSKIHRHVIYCPSNPDCGDVAGWNMADCWQTYRWSWECGDTADPETAELHYWVKACLPCFNAGCDAGEVIDTYEAAGFTVNVIPQSHPTFEAGEFIGSSLECGEEPVDCTVDVCVSTGPQTPDQLTVTFTSPLANGDVYYNVPVWIEVRVNGGVGARSVHFQLFDGETPNAVVPANGIYGFWHTFTIHTVPNTYVTVPIRVQAYDSASHSTQIVERWVRSFGPES